MARRSEHSQAEIRQMVLEAAEEIVQEDGFPALKVRKIAADIGYTVGSIYMVFTNINDLNMHIKARTWQKLHLHLHAHLKKDASVQSIVRAYLDFAIANQGLWRMLFEHQLALGELVPSWYMQETQQVFALLFKVLRELDKQHSDAEVQMAAQTLIKSVQGIAMQLLMQNQTQQAINSAKVETELLATCFMRGWLAQ